MRLPALLLVALLALPLAAAPISPATHAAVMRIADEAGVPRSVAHWLMVEESGNWHTGAWGDASAVNRDEPGGWESRGLYQLYMEPGNIADLLARYWYAYHEREPFDEFNPIHSAKVGLRYLADLHKRWGTWYKANALYNGGSAYSYLRARRIVEAGEP